MIKALLKWLEKPGKFEIIDRWMKGPPKKVLDIGCGNHSPSNTVKYYPNVEYYGLDMQMYENDENDMKVMKQYWEVDLNKNGNLSQIPDNYFDCIIFSHVIEHIHDGIGILNQLTQKLKKGGHIYIETPAPISLKLPSMEGTLNFYDDPTHVKLYQVKEINSALSAQGFKVLKSGTRRLWKRILLLPIYALGSFARFKKLQAVVIWDLVGFCSYSLAEKTR